MKMKKHNNGLISFFTASKRAISYFFKNVESKKEKCQEPEEHREQLSTARNGSNKSNFGLQVNMHSSQRAVYQH